MILPENLLPLDPLTDFVIIMFLILLLPNIFEKFKLPGVLGLLLGGFIIGPNFIGLLIPGEGIVSFVGDVGKLMVMFFAGLEINFDEFVKSWKKSVTFGSLTFILPLIAGAGLSLALDFPFVAAILIGSLLASHTLVSLPILIKYNLVKREAAAVTVGATIFTDIAALILLSVCVSIFTVGMSWSILGVRFIGLVIYLPLVLFGARWLATKSFKWMDKNDDNKTIMMLFIMSLTALGAEVIHLEGIVGAFVSGLAVNEIIHDGRAKHKMETLGNTLFIPMFFIVIGSLIDPMSFAAMEGAEYLFVIGLVLLLIFAKYLAAKISSLLLKYSNTEANLMWSLSIPQVAATLAAAMVAYQTKNAAGERLISKMVFDAVLVLMAVTTVLGPVLSDHFCKKLHESAD